MSESGGTGRRARLRGVWFTPYGFKSRFSHHKEHCESNALFLRFQTFTKFILMQPVGVRLPLEPDERSSFRLRRYRTSTALGSANEQRHLPTMEIVIRTPEYIRLILVDGLKSNNYSELCSRVWDVSVLRIITLDNKNGFGTKRLLYLGSTNG